jgi:NADP-dependent 3-hydroxy acid dehydrogenase YdfG
MQQVILITGASSGLARWPPCIRMRVILSTPVCGIPQAVTLPQVQSTLEYARQHNVDLRTVELDVQSQDSADAAIAQIIAQDGRLDVVVHNAGHMVYGPTEAFLPEQFSQLYDINVLGTQR